MIRILSFYSVLFACCGGLLSSPVAAQPLVPCQSDEECEAPEVCIQVLTDEVDFDFACQPPRAPLPEPTPNPPGLMDSCETDADCQGELVCYTWEPFEDEDEPGGLSGEAVSACIPHPDDIPLGIAASNSATPNASDTPGSDSAASADVASAGESGAEDEGSGCSLTTTPVATSTSPSPTNISWLMLMLSALVVSRLRRR